MKHVWLITGLLAVFIHIEAEVLRVVSYNVENLFHPKHDSIMVDSTWMETDDYEWTPEGLRRWSYTRYIRKTENIARVLTNIGEWEGVDVVGLQEVENAKVVKKLCETMRRGEYGFVHYDSPDRRGIDVAMIYKKSRIDTLQTKAIRIQHSELYTRDILYVCAKIKNNLQKRVLNDTIHFFVCHMPSQRGGVSESEWKRETARKVLRHITDSILERDHNAKIVVMGDMNSSSELEINPLQFKKTDKGTHKYQGRWECLDQIYVTANIDSISRVRIYDEEWIMEPDEKYMGLKPKRTYNGFRYQNGYSDHLPIVLEIFDNNK